MFAAYSSVELGIQAYRRLGVDRRAEEKTAQAKREFHLAIAEYAKDDAALKRANPAEQKVPPPPDHACPVIVRSFCSAF